MGQFSGGRSRVFGVNFMTQKALVIATETATNGKESGGALRVQSITKLIEQEGFEVTTASRGKAKAFLQSEWDLIVLVSYSTARLLRAARKKTPVLWFDPTDSWMTTRISLIKKGYVIHFVLLLRDLFWLWLAPKLEIITFITDRDMNCEKFWWKNRCVPMVIPVYFLDRAVNQSEKLRLVFVGDGHYGPNKKAIHFLEETLRYLPENISIELYGSNLHSSNSRIRSYGYVSNENLYFSNDIHLAPVSIGGGLKLKVAIPLWNGLKVISTSEATTGFSKNENLIVANSPKEFAQAISDEGVEELHEPRLKGKFIFSSDQTDLVLEILHSKS